MTGLWSVITSGLLRNQRHHGVFDLGEYDRCRFTENGFHASCGLPEVRVFLLPWVAFSGSLTFIFMTARCTCMQQLKRLAAPVVVISVSVAVFVLSVLRIQ